MSEYEDQQDDNEAICPYCGERYQVECEDYDEDVHVIECGGCELKFYLNQSFSVTHNTRPDCELNGEPHQFERVEFGEGKKYDRCIVCDKYQRVKP